MGTAIDLTGMPYPSKLLADFRTDFGRVKKFLPALLKDG